MTTTEHEHAFGVTEDPQRPEIDVKLLDQLVGAAFDGCTSCQDPLLTLLVQDPAATARLVELACVAVANILGGLPGEMTTPGHPGLSSDAFRRLAALGADGGNDALFAECARMSEADRRAAANTALNTLVGVLSTPLT